MARELVPVLAHLGFRCVVMDDREEFASPRVFPEAEQIVVGDMERIGGLPCRGAKGLCLCDDKRTFF